MANPHPTVVLPKGNQIAKGNDKTTKLSTFIEKALERVIPNSLEEYNEIRTYRQQLAEKLVDTAILSDKPDVALAYIKEIADRTEGKPKQSTELSGEVSIVTPIYSGKSFIEPVEND
jgi:hypothetical protein